MDTNGKIRWPTFHTYVDGADICVQKSFVINTGLFHARDHAFAAEIAKCGVVELDMAWQV